MDLQHFTQLVGKPKRDQRCNRFITILVGFMLLALTGLVHAANWQTETVDSTADTVADDGACTLRESIINANNDDQSGSVDCAAGREADTIVFSVDGTITLGSTLPEITSEMTIDGVEQFVTVSGYRFKPGHPTASMTCRESLTVSPRVH